MTKESVSEFTKEIEDAIHKIWKRPPDEIDNLNDVSSIPGQHRYGRIDLANGMLRELYYFLGILKSCAMEGVSIECLIPVTIKVLERDSIFTFTYGLYDTTELMKRAIVVLPDIQNPNEYSNVVGKLSVYLSKLAHVGWIDALLLHAADMELLYDLMFPPSDPKKP